MALPDAESRASLEKQYYFLQDRVEQRNQACLEIKKWAVTVASAVAVAGQWKEGFADPALLVIAGLALIFWLTETMWRAEQWVFIRCIREMELENPTGPGISEMWGRHYFGSNPPAHWSGTGAGMAGEASWARVAGHFIRWRTALPHVLIFVAACLAFLVSQAS